MSAGAWGQRSELLIKKSVIQNILQPQMRNPITNATPFVFLFLNNMIENHRHLFYENANPAYADAMPQGDSKSGVVPYAI
ncbi:hypothetical protein AAEX37_02209 [Oligella sp. MSHR50489EDL]